MNKILKWAAVGALVFLGLASIYAMVLLVLPATMFAMSLPFKVPESVVNPYLGRAITLTFGFLAAVLLIKYMIGWAWFEKKILAFAGIVAVFVAWNLFMWWVTTAEPRKKMSELQEQSAAQQAEIVRLKEEAAQEEEQGNKIQREDVAGRHTERKYASVVSALPRWARRVGTALGVMLGLFVGIVLIPFAGFCTAEKIVGHDDPGFGFLLTAVFYIMIAVVACSTWSIVG